MNETLAEVGVEALATSSAMTLDMRLARLGELTTMVTLISPLPAFVSCHKKSFEKNKMLEKISFNFLLAMFICNETWLAYAIKIDNMDLVVINALGTIIAGLFVFMFLYVKTKVTNPHKYIALLLGGIIFATLVSSNLIEPWTNGLIATLLSMSQYVFTLDSV